MGKNDDPHISKEVDVILSRNSLSVVFLHD